jgi:hypothetical protein
MRVRAGDRFLVPLSGGRTLMTRVADIVPNGVCVITNDTEVCSLLSVLCGS